MLNVAAAWVNLSAARKRHKGDDSLRLQVMELELKLRLAEIQLERERERAAVEKRLAALEGYEEAGAPTPETDSAHPAGLASDQTVKQIFRTGVERFEQAHEG